MQFSINNYSVNAKDKGWGDGWPTSRNDDMRKVVAEKSGVKFNVHRQGRPAGGHSCSRRPSGGDT